LATKELISLSRREADIAISLTRPEEQTSVTRQLGQLRFALYASEQYLASATEYQFIAYDESVEETPQQGWLKSQAQGRAPIFFSNDLRVQAIAAAGHVGVALLPEYLAKEYSLMQVNRGGPTLAQGIWLSVHEDVKHTSRIRATLNFLGECIEPSNRL
jgi:DNA-binding transcriptional LysR family regulator